jgi:cytochrome bd-type quinol oxidase subunit 2
VSTRTEKALQKVIRAERWRNICSWCVALGATLLALALSMVIGGGGAGNPKTALSIFSALEASGLLREFAIRIAVVGLVVLVAGLLAGVIARRR